MLLVGVAAVLGMIPAKPTPNFSWDTIPIAFHGANKVRMYNSSEVAQLARYSMVTLEKWYTLCGDQHPQQAGPDCNVESKMATTFDAIKAINPNVTTLLYLNSMFNFGFYHLNQVLLDREAQGFRTLLRDKNDVLVTLCNDGNYYCNITNFDWSVPEVADIWIETLVNLTKAHGVDGVFADHGFEHSVMPSRHDLQPPNDPTLCNGSGDLRTCWHFEPSFAPQFNHGHDSLLNRTQDILAKSTGGPVIDGPYADWGIEACDYTTLRKAVEQGQRGQGAFIIEASKGGACTPSESCMAAFLCAAEEYTYLACFNSQNSGQGLPEFIPEFSKPLGPPTGPAVNEKGTLRRTFKSSVGETVVSYNEKSGVGHIKWADEY